MVITKLWSHWLSCGLCGLGLACSSPEDAARPPLAVPPEGVASARADASAPSAEPNPGQPSAGELPAGQNEAPAAGTEGEPLPSPEGDASTAGPERGPGDAGAVLPPDTSLPSGVLSRFPSAGAVGVCQDLPLRLTFADDVSLGNTGSIRIFRSDAPEVAVDTVNMAATAFPDTIAGLARNRVRPVFIEGRDVVVYFRHDVLEPDTSYFVRVDAGVFLGPGGAPQAAIGDRSWVFSTGARPVASERLVVQREGAGDFCTLQGAFDAIPEGTAPTEVELRNGTYHELAILTRKSNVTLRGEDRDDTVVAYPNNDNLNPGTAARAMLTALNTNNLVIENLTLHNTTPQGGSQAEALRVRADQVILRNARFLSLQDTLLLEGRVYIADSTVEGNVDFIWGQGTAYFERTEIKLVGRSGVIVQSRNGAGASGYIFVDSRLTSDPNITNSTLARIDVTEYPNSQVAYIDCEIGPHISRAGWTVTPTGTTDTGALQFLEYRSTNPGGQLLDVSGRHPASRQLGAAEAAAFRDRAAVLGGWDPTLE